MENFLDKVMHSGICTTLTICGTAKNRELKEKYQAYYTIKNNLVFMPVNYMSIKNDVENDYMSALQNALHLAEIHDKKIDLSEAIIIVTNDDGYFGYHTERELNYATEKGKYILRTHIDKREEDKYYFNNDTTYPLYMLKSLMREE